MTKSEAIKAAYGEHWEKLSEEAKDFVLSNDGYVSYWHWSHFNMDFDFDLKTGGLYRPKSLSGIETNNGWTRIESEEDLSEVLTDYWVIIDGIVRKGFKYYGNGRWTNADNPYPKTTSSYKITHYQPIETPKPPIF
ncbi:hypothetical protein CMU04_06455 [Elizabethkingia anophelis]|nr:hypothetical protein [Elizabethkingia anophelis]